MENAKTSRTDMGFQVCTAFPDPQDFVLTVALRSSWFRLVKGRDVYPFVLSLGIVVQGIVYATAQAKGLESLMILGCATISRMMLLGMLKEQ